MEKKKKTFRLDVSNLEENPVDEVKYVLTRRSQIVAGRGWRMVKSHAFGDFPIDGIKVKLVLRDRFTTKLIKFKLLVGPLAQDYTKALRCTLMV